MPFPPVPDMHTNICTDHPHNLAGGNTNHHHSSIFVGCIHTSADVHSSHTDQQWRHCRAHLAAEDVLLVMGVQAKREVRKHRLRLRRGARGGAAVAVGALCVRRRRATRRGRAVIAEMRQRGCGRAAQR